MRKEVQNKLYKPTLKIGRGKLIQISWYFINVIFFANPLVTSSMIKSLFLRLFGATIGKSVVIKPCVKIKFPWKLTVGDYAWIGENAWIDNLFQVNIGNNVCISQGAMLLTGSHDHTKVGFDFIANEIVLEEGVWIGAKAIVLGGVVCKSHSILGVNAVAETNLDPYVIYKGNPAVPVIIRVIV